MIEENQQNSAEPVVNDDSQDSPDSANEQPVEALAQGENEETKSQQPEENLVHDDDPKGVKKRISKLTAEKKKLQEELEFIKGQTERYQADVGQIVDPYTGETISRPNKASFDDPLDYVEAISEYKEKQEKVSKLQQLQYVQVQKEQQLRQTFDRQKDLARQKYDDFDIIDQRVANDQSFPISQTMADVIYQSPNGADIYYWLGTNPQESARISQLNPIQAARELGHLESQFLEPQKIQSKAPKPLPAEGNSHHANKDFVKMSFREQQAYIRGR